MHDMILLFMWPYWGPNKCRGVACCFQAPFVKLELRDSGDTTLPGPPKCRTELQYPETISRNRESGSIASAILSMLEVEVSQKLVSRALQISAKPCKAFFKTQNASARCFYYLEFPKSAAPIWTPHSRALIVSTPHPKWKKKQPNRSSKDQL